MTFTKEQIEQLEAALPASAIRRVDKGSRGTHEYLSGFHAISAANRVFGFEGWSTEIVHLQCVESSQQGNPNYTGSNNREGYFVAYTARVRVTVGEQSHEDVGYGDGTEYNNVGQAHESAIKEAVTDAEKRALRHWGNQFGLSLYDKDRDKAPPAPATKPAAPPTVNDADLLALQTLARDAGLTVDTMKGMVATYGVANSKALTRPMYDDMVAKIKASMAATQQPETAA